MTKTAGKVLLGIGIPVTGLGAYILWYAAGRSYYDSEAALHAQLIGGAGVIMLSLGLGRLVHWAAGAVVCVAAVGFAFYLLSSKSAEVEADAKAGEEQRAMAERFWKVCASSAGVEDAAPYSADGPGPRPTVIFTQSTDDKHYPWMGIKGEEWFPDSAAETQLVGCVKTETKSHGVCSYTSFSGDGDRLVGRNQYVEKVRIHAAKTGELLASTTVLGGEPPAKCPAEMTFEVGGSSGDLNGSMPSDAEVMDFFRKTVE